MTIIRENLPNLQDARVQNKQPSAAAVHRLAVSALSPLNWPQVPLVPSACVSTVEGRIPWTFF